MAFTSRERAAARTATLVRLREFYGPEYDLLHEEGLKKVGPRLAWNYATFKLWQRHKHLADAIYMEEKAYIVRNRRRSA